MDNRRFTRDVSHFDTLTREMLCHMCRNIIDYNAMYDNSIISFAQFLDKVCQLRYTQRRAARIEGLQAKREMQEKEIDEILNRFFSAQLTIFSGKCTFSQK